MKNLLGPVHGLIVVSLLGCVTTSPDSGGPAATGAGGTGGTGGAGGSAVTPSTGVAVLVGTVCGDLQLAGAETIAAGETVTICAGSRFTAANARAGITVLGTLVIAGTAASPVRFVGLGNPRDWSGIEIQRGGTVTATYVEIHDATVALAARSGSSFDIDHALIDNSSQLLVVASTGKLAHGTLHGLGSAQQSTPVFIDDGSPLIVDTVVNQGAFGGVDMVVATGASSAPVFDRVEVADSHCAFHFDDATGATISNSFIHHNAYGFMVINSADGHVVHNNFEDNAINIGTCGSGSTEVKDNYFVGQPFDGSCAHLTVTGTAPPGAYTTGVGPSP